MLDFGTGGKGFRWLEKPRSATRALIHTLTDPNAVGDPLLHLRRNRMLFERSGAEGTADKPMHVFMVNVFETFENGDRTCVGFPAAWAGMRDHVGDRSLRFHPH